MLLDMGGKRSRCDRPGRRHLHTFGHAEIINKVLQNGAAVDDRTNDGWTPLTFASDGGYAEIVNLLLQNGAAVDAQTNDGWTPLIFASHGGHAKIVNLLLENGAAVDARANDRWH